MQKYKSVFLSRMFLILILLLILIPPSSQAEGFKFAAMSDSRGPYNGVNDPVLSAMIEHLIKTQPDVKFVVFAGDMVNGHKDDPDRTVRELLHWREVMAPIYNNPNMIEPKIWPVIGNHEVQHPDDRDNFRKVFPETLMNGPDEDKGLSYSFDYNNSHFCMINTDNWYYGDPLDSTDDRIDWHYIKHMDWLETDIKEAYERGVEHIFTFSHEMPFPMGGHLRDGLPNLRRNFTLPLDSTRQWYLERRDRFWDMMKEYNADAHICGHEHSYGRQSIDDVYQIITGSVGAPLYYHNPKYDDDEIPEEEFEMPYRDAIKFYEVLNYNYGAGQNSQRSKDFVGYRAFNYCVFDVQKDFITVETYGSFPKENSYNEMGTEIKLIDKFVIRK